MECFRSKFKSEDLLRGKVKKKIFWGEALIFTNFSRGRLDPYSSGEDPCFMEVLMGECNFIQS